MPNKFQIKKGFWRFSDSIVSIGFASARSFLLCGFGICFLLFFLTHCSTANLNSNERRGRFKPVAEDVAIREMRQDVIRNIDPAQRYQKEATMRIIASDIWESTVIRWLTPLDENEQKFQAHLKLYHQGIEYTFLYGERKGRTIGFDGRSYQYDGTRKHYKESSKIALYLGPLQSYFEWHQTLLRNPTLETIGTKEINNINYLVLYATEGPTAELDEHDQYAIYVNTNSRRIDYIEFTMRKLMKSYTGVVHYRNHKRVQGILMPFWIGIADDLLQPAFDHYFVVESITFDSNE